MKQLRFLLAACALFLVGCGSTGMKMATNQSINKPQEGKAQVVFMRSSFVGGAIDAAVHEVTNDEPEFIGIMANNRKIAVNVEPGFHRFMVTSEAADFVEANLDAGRTYYVVVTPRMGMWSARFSLWPVKNGKPGKFTTEDKDFRNTLAKTKLVENTDASYAWFNKNLHKIKSKFAEYIEVWKAKSPEDLAERTLVGSDGL